MHMDIEGAGDSLFTLARRYDLLLSVQVVFMAFNMAAAAFQSSRRLEHVPQRLHAGLAVGREVVESRNKFMSFVANII